MAIAIILATIVALCFVASICATETTMQVLLKIGFIILAVLNGALLSAIPGVAEQLIQLVNSL